MQTQPTSASADACAGSISAKPPAETTRYCPHSRHGTIDFIDEKNGITGSIYTPSLDEDSRYWAVLSHNDASGEVWKNTSRRYVHCDMGNLVRVQ